MQVKEVRQDNYYEDTGHMSVSKYKKMLKCHGQGATEKTDALLIGSYVDAFIEGTLDEFKAENPEIFSSRGATKGFLKSNYAIAEKVCERLTSDVIAMKFLSGEKQTIMTGKISGVPFKIKMDSYIPKRAIVDLKVMRTIRNNKGKLYNFISVWGYDTQLACYQEIVFQNTGERLPCYIVVATKEDPIEVRVISIPQETLDEKLLLVENNINELYNVYIGISEPIYCGNCKWCIGHGKYDKIISLTDLEDREI